MAKELRRTEFTVTLTEEAGSPYPISTEVFKYRESAEREAKKLARENPDKLVFISFYRRSDGQDGYINPDGADITGKSWTEQ